MASCPSSSNASLLGISPETRLRIYEYHFSTINLTICSSQDVGVFCRGCSDLHDMRTLRTRAFPSYIGQDLHGECQLIATNRQIREEATPTLRTALNELHIIGWGNVSMHSYQLECNKHEADHGLIALKERIPYAHLKVLKFSLWPPPVDWASFAGLKSIVITLNDCALLQAPVTNVASAQIEGKQVVTDQAVLRGLAEISFGLHQLKKSVTSSTFATHPSLQKVIVQYSVMPDSEFDFSFPNRSVNFEASLVLDAEIMEQMEATSFDEEAIHKTLQWTISPVS